MGNVFCPHAGSSDVAGVSSITFLVTVNDTWKWDPPISNDTCMVTIKTNSIAPNTPRNKSENIMVGNCDNGPLVYTANSASSIFLTFYSSVVLDASPPTCTINWNGSYLLPTQPPGQSTTLESLLPGCFIADSREGYHMTNYWFYILDWGTSHKDGMLGGRNTTLLIVVCPQNVIIGQGLVPPSSCTLQKDS